MSKKAATITIPEDIQNLLDSTPDSENVAETIREDVARLDKDPAAVTEFLKMQIVEDIYRAMELQGVSQSQLAERLGKSRQYVSSALNERNNFTVKSLAAIACALDLRVGIRLYSGAERLAVLSALTQARLLDKSHLKLAPPPPAPTGRQKRTHSRRG